MYEANVCSVLFACPESGCFNCWCVCLAKLSFGLDWHYRHMQYISTKILCAAYHLSYAIGTEHANRLMIRQKKKK